MFVFCFIYKLKFHFDMSKNGVQTWAKFLLRFSIVLVNLVALSCVHAQETVLAWLESADLNTSSHFL